MTPRLLTSILLPFLALALQWVLWPWIKPFVWFLFFPTVFFSARLGGLKGGLASTVLATGMVWYFFIPPQLGWTMHNPENLWSVALFLGMGWLFSDASERLIRAQRHTEAALEETRAANEKITQLYKKTLELDELKTQFFANVSHELRTPLTLIISPLTRRLEHAELPEATRHEDEMMLRNARLLYRHVSDLLDAAKLESGGMRLDYARLDLAGLVRAMAAHFDSLASEKGIDYRIEADALLKTEVDGEKTQRILLNLLSNAFKFTPDGGRIVVRARQVAGQAIIEVEDNGPGVPADLRLAVFERFRQIEGGAQRRYGGTGLGLAIVKEFAELHAGDARVEDSSGGGARFVVRLPLHAPADAEVRSASGQIDPVIDRQALDELRPAQPTAPSRAIADDSNKPLILVVEDNPDMNAYLADILRSRYRVASAGDGRVGLEQALALRPDLILSDVMMPRMSGDQMVVELRRHAELADVPIVMLTAKADDELRVRLFEQGVQDYLDKPFSVEELLARVAGPIAERKRSVEQLQASEERLRLALEAARDGLWDWDLRSGKVFRSRRYYQLVGRRPEEDAADFGFFKSTVHPDDQSRVLATIDAHRRGETPAIEFDYRRAGGCDETKWLRVRGQVVKRGADGAPLRMVGTLTDITAQQQAEQEIHNLNATLERRVAERTAELTAANQELDSFAYAVSHDLRAPLRAMSGFAQALGEDYGKTLQGDAKLYLAQIDLASRKMGELIDGLLTLPRSTRGDMKHDPVDVSALSRQVLAELALADPQRKVAVVAEAGMQARGDARMIEVVLRNLLGNAWKYTANSTAPSIRVYAEEREDGRHYCVADNGAGFDMAHANRLYQPFQRLHRQEEFPGIGIGLATVQRIVHRHGGAIEAHAEPGKGATFCFTLAGTIGAAL
jgi:PAS domain S-box-containing protein